MTPTETAALLAIVASFDRRTNSEAEVIVWHKALGDLHFDSCRDAVVAHYRDETVWLMPAHVRKRVLGALQDAAMRQLPEARGDLVPMPPWFGALYRKSLAEARARGTYAERGPMAASMDNLANGDQW